MKRIPDPISKRIDRMFVKLSPLQKKAYRILVAGLSTGIDLSDIYTNDGGPKANTIYEPTSVTAAEFAGDFDGEWNNTATDDQVNELLDTDGILDQAMLFLLTKVSTL